MNRSRGFTIMEIVVSIVILGVLAGLAVPRYSTVVESFRSKEGIQILHIVLQGQLGANVDVAEGRLAAPYSLSDLEPGIVTWSLDHFNPPALNFTGTGGVPTVNIGGTAYPVYAHIVRTTGAYTLYVQSDGNILCTPQAVCQPMKYDPW